MIPEHGIIIMNKPKGVTSSKAILSVKRKLKLKKIGHAGTLDQFATGVLICLCGKFTKLSSYFMDLEKTYTADIRFGEETDTLDPEGKVVRTGPVPETNSLEKALESFIGEIKQTPPIYSAVHIDGKRAYQHARSGAEVDIPERIIRIYDFTILSYNPPVLTVSIRCSKGTYIRSLARDLGRKLGSAGFVQDLRRDAIGPFSIKDSVHPKAIEPEQHILQPREVIEKLPNFAHITIKPEMYSSFKNGLPISDEVFNEKGLTDMGYGSFTEDNELQAVLLREKGRWNYIFNM
ncbi:MAG: tRNA pseudouridine(55) synthase TruB [Spirochaetia bacterium]